MKEILPESPNHGNGTFSEEVTVAILEHYLGLHPAGCPESELVAVVKIAEQGSILLSMFCLLLEGKARAELSKGEPAIRLAESGGLRASARPLVRRILREALGKEVV